MLVGASLGVSACVPAPRTYLRPSAPGGQYTKSTCAGGAGPEDRVALAASEGIMVGVESYSLEEVSAVMPADRPKVGTGFSIILQIPPGKALRFASSSFVLTDQLTQTMHEQQATTVLDFPDAHVLLDGLVVAMSSGPGPPRVRQIAMRDTLIGASQPDWFITPRWFGTILSHPYYVVVPFEGVTCRDCRLRLPPLAVGSTTQQFPEISFKLVKEWLLEPLNC